MFNISRAGRPAGQPDRERASPPPVANCRTIGRAAVPSSPSPPSTPLQPYIDGPLPLRCTVGAARRKRVTKSSSSAPSKICPPLQSSLVNHPPLPFELTRVLRSTAVPFFCIACTEKTISRNWSAHFFSWRGASSNEGCKNTHNDGHSSKRQMQIRYVQCEQKLSCHQKITWRLVELQQFFKVIRLANRRTNTQNNVLIHEISEFRSIPRYTS